ncbi:hypothetical protein [Micromonospora sp. WMMD1082]|uniref:AbiTii domain-containing protein n=1 Tax=Micromonospora sp. WMMD1082 TaxID=3016104 RepID=UPI002417B675|nr:hypothetical protein [Micromonospora sp. WMMD1082]MDG4796959.1 hypothetical protein [Micromonospora sp. WMMD1082]
MTDTLLRSLRERLLDESEPLAGLLRKCLLLGAETGSEALRDWARKELNGYGADDKIPQYRKIPSPPIAMDSFGGFTVAQNQIIDRNQLPHDAGKYLSDTFPFRQPIEELERLAVQSHSAFGSSGLAYAQSAWNSRLDEFEGIMGLRYVVSGSTIAGILGQIRTNLVDLVADLTADTPLTELPKKDQVDAAVSHRIGDVYNTTIQSTNGPVAIGAKAKASTEGLTVEDVLRLLDKVQEAAADIADSQRVELLDALTELRAAVESDEPDTGEVMAKTGRLRAIASKLGVGSVTAAAGGAAQAVTELAFNGAFG